MNPNLVLGPDSERKYSFNSNLAVGYTINNKEYLRMNLNNHPIGAYGITFDKECHYIYRCLQTTKGFFIRKEVWKNILNQFDSKG